MDIPASPGCEDYPKLMYQSHFDMVAVASKDYLDFDPATTPIKPIYDKSEGVIHTG